MLYITLCLSSFPQRAPIPTALLCGGGLNADDHGDTYRRLGQQLRAAGHAVARLTSQHLQKVTLRPF